MKKYLVLAALLISTPCFAQADSGIGSRGPGYATSSKPGLVKLGDTLSMSATGVLDVNNINGVSVTPTGGTADTLADLLQVDGSTIVRGVNGLSTSNPSGTLNAAALDGVIGATGTANIFKNIIRLPDGTYGAQNGYLYNADPQNLPSLRACLQAVRANTDDCIILGLGDSNMIGISTSTGGVWQNLTTNISRNLNQVGIPSHAAGWFGGSTDHGDDGSRDTDTSMTVGSWAFYTDVTTLGGAILRATASGTQFSWSPKDNYGNPLIIDAVDIYHTCVDDQASFNVAVNSATPLTINESTCGSWSIIKTTATGPSGAALITLTHDTSTNTAFVLGMVPRNSAKKQVIFVNAGWSGSTVAQTADDGLFFSPIQSIALLTPDAAIHQWGILDITETTATGTFKSNVQEIMTAVASGGGDNIILTPRPVSTNIALAPNYMNVLLELSATNNAPLAHNWARWGGLSNNAPAAFILDDYHPTAAGYGDLAALPSQMIINLLGAGQSQPNNMNTLVPATSTSPCVKGMMTIGSGFIYSCVATDTWKRATLDAF